MNRPAPAFPDPGLANATLIVPEWRKRQNYRYNRPPFIKLHRDRFDPLEAPPAFASLSDAERYHLIALELLYSQRDERLPADPARLQQALGLDSPPDIAKFVALGFFELAAVGPVDEPGETYEPEEEDEPEDADEVEAEPDPELQSARVTEFQSYRDIRKENRRSLAPSALLASPTFLDSRPGGKRPPRPLECPGTADGADATGARRYTPLGRDVGEPTVALIRCRGTDGRHAVARPALEAWVSRYPSIDVLSELREMAAWAERSPAKRWTHEHAPGRIAAWLQRAEDGPPVDYASTKRIRPLAKDERWKAFRAIFTKSAAWPTERALRAVATAAEFEAYRAQQAACEDERLRERAAARIRGPADPEGLRAILEGIAVI